jgi:hypothetical protein
MQLCNRSALLPASYLLFGTGAERHFMARDKKDKQGASPQPGSAKPGDPEWAAGLKRLYDSVVEEPLPDSFKDLLRKLDAAG